MFYDSKPCAASPAPSYNYYLRSLCLEERGGGGGVVREIRLSYKNDGQREIKLNPLQHWGCRLACEKRPSKTKTKVNLFAFISFSRELLPRHPSNNPSLCGSSCNNPCFSSFGLKFGTSVTLQFEQGPSWAPACLRPGVSKWTWEGRSLKLNCIDLWSEAEPYQRSPSPVSAHHARL